MNKEQFIKELSFLLQDISDEDRSDAIDYYEDYFAEAGKENEEKVIRELQSPERVAAIIKAGLNSSFDENIEYSESSMKNSGYDKPDEIIVNQHQEEQKQEKSHYERKRKSGFQGDEGRNRILLLIIIGIVCIFGLPFFGVGFGILAAIFMVLFGLGIVFGALGFAAFVVAMVLIIKGLTVLSVATGAALISIGSGLVCIALSMLLFMNVKWPFKIVPNLIRGIVDGIRTMVTKVGEKL